ncbi:MAG: flagellar basal body P-ring formation protein FlgA [Pseudomonadales bacterium]|nr:flagellar basal body P-ring formation protein FlgA [Pseudomonadales bacterium]
MTVTNLTARKVFGATAVIAVGFIANSNAEVIEHESADAIQTVAERYALEQLATDSLQQVTAEASALDTRLRLKKCSEPLQTFGNGTEIRSSRVTVGVRCTGNSPWTLYVPVTVHALAPVVYTSKPLLRGEIVEPASLEIRQEPLDRLPRNALQSFEQVIGMEVSRAMSADSPLSLGNLRSPKLIRQGQEVIILAEGAGLAVRMAGNALKNGAKGEVIPVKNSSSGRVLEGRIVSESTVLVGF